MRNKKNADKKTLKKLVHLTRNFIHSSFGALNNKILNQYRFTSKTNTGYQNGSYP